MMEARTMERRRVRSRHSRRQRARIWRARAQKIAFWAVVIVACLGAAHVAMRVGNRPDRPADMPPE